MRWKAKQRSITEMRKKGLGEDNNTRGEGTRRRGEVCVWGRGVDQGRRRRCDQGLEGTRKDNTLKGWRVCV